MPTAPKRYSPLGQRQQHREDRPSSTQRGYDRHWSKLRRLFLTRNPWCQRCLQEQKHTPAEEVDHIQPFQHKDDPKRLDWSNLMALCKRHHSQKTVRDTRAGRTRKR